jgi:hypothetical protein
MTSWEFLGRSRAVGGGETDFAQRLGKVVQDLGADQTGDLKCGAREYLPLSRALGSVQPYYH